MSTLLLAALLVGAQTKIAPKMKKGMKKVYVTETTVSSEFTHPISISQETVFEVIDATNDGYILDVYVTDVKTDANDAESRIYSLATEMLKGVHTKYATDKDGKVTKVLETEEVANNIDGMLDKLLGGLSLPSEMSASDMKSQLKKQVNEENLTQSLQASTSPLALNGKTISTGTEEEFLNQNNLKGLKMKRIYTVNKDGTISSSANINMNNKDIQSLISGVIGSMGSEAISDDTLSGLSGLFGNVNLQCSEQSTYTFGKDGWVKNITSEMTTSAMGMSFSTKSKVTLK
jgi:hypothetical protein